ncbi:MAG: type III-B CRISPR module-associated protein Cmr5 [Desulfobacterales bacterium]
MISKEQKRSDFALKQLKDTFSNDGDLTIKKDIANFIVGAPTMILQNGFGQTMAFLLSKCKGKTEKKDKHFFTFTTIARWSERINEKVQPERSGFFEAVSSLEQTDYLKLQEEALKMLQWLKRYARAFQEE